MEIIKKLKEFFEKDEVIKKLKEFFEKDENKEKLIANLDKNENDLLDILELEKKIDRLVRNPPSGKGLFGYSSTQTDYLYKNNAAVEVKRIKEGNESEVKNGLAQVLEQAVGLEKENAVLLIIDDGRAKDRSYNEQEIKFIKTFVNNPFNINFKVFRVRVDKENIVYIEIYPEEAN